MVKVIRAMDIPWELSPTDFISRSLHAAHHSPHPDHYRAFLPHRTALGQHHHWPNCWAWLIENKSLVPQISLKRQVRYQYWLSQSDFYRHRGSNTWSVKLEAVCHCHSAVEEITPFLGKKGSHQAFPKSSRTLFHNLSLIRILQSACFSVTADSLKHLFSI